ncbi:hypothetical protein LTR39_006128, partial [Cryomyces antarcticus]
MSVTHPAGSFVYRIAEQSKRDRLERVPPMGPYRLGSQKKRLEDGPESPWLSVHYRREKAADCLLVDEQELTTFGQAMHDN